MSDFDTADFFTDESLVEDPFPYFDHLRRRCPVTRLPAHDVIAVTGYDESHEVFRSWENFSSCNAVTGPFPGLPPSPDLDDLTDLIAVNRSVLPMSEYLVTHDPPTHTALRGLLMRLLTPRRLSESEPALARLADRQLDKVLEAGRFEVLHGFAQPFALLVIAELLGVPQEDHQAFSTQFGLERTDPAITGDQQVSLDPLAFLFVTFTAYVEDRRRAPRGDVLTRMATATYPDGTVPAVADVVRTATFLFAAGQDTTARLITAALQVLGDDPDLQSALRARRELIPDFIEEVLRLEGPIKLVSRVAKVATTVAGVDIPTGTTVSVFLHGANRDPRHFDHPDELRLDRTNSRDHVSFGRGIHACPGAPLARVETRIALEHLFDRTADIRLSESQHGPPGARRFEYDPTYLFRGVRKLHVEVTSSGR